MKRVLVIHGLGMNMRGKVKQQIYGHETLADYDAEIRAAANELGVLAEIFQSNLEGELINKLYQGHEDNIDGVVLNPGGFAVGYRGLVAAIEQLTYPVVEVHVSNPMTRGLVSDVGKVSKATVVGFGIQSYRLALVGLEHLLNKQPRDRQVAATSNT